LRASKDFALTTKTGVRATSLSLVVYLKVNSKSLNAPQIGLIVNKSVGGSVTRHRVSRQLRHLVSARIPNLPTDSQLVIRVLRQQPDFNSELNELIQKVISKLAVNA
jgi:ribonuclease P protein component